MNMEIRKITLLLIFLLITGCSLLKQEPKGKVYIKKIKIKKQSREDEQKYNYQLIVDKKPFIVKGVCYSPVPIGQQGILYNFVCDPKRPWLVDGKLMKEMGVNTIRLYHSGDELEFCRTMIEDLYKIYGIRTILGYTLGFWDYPPANYADPEFRKEITEKVLNTVEYFKDTPGILIWNLGNENNYSFDGRINPWSSDEIDAMDSFGKKRDARAKIYYSFVNELAKKIKEIDPIHLVSLGNGETVGLKIAAENCPDIDLLGCIVYRGKVFGNFFKEVKRKFDRPVILTEFGCDAYNMVKKQEDQKNQAKFLKSQWLDIQNNMDGGEGVGNCLGGVVFEWNDEWWKSSESDRNSWWVHDNVAAWGMGSYDFDAKADKNMNEEWFGIVGLDPELDANGLNKRNPRKAYYVLRKLWNKEYQDKEPEQDKETGKK
ncbi:MAG: glycoside hydrolase family 2 TIM barrel-domain containing protein [Candidatus Omnitrophota bacterium]